MAETTNASATSADFYNKIKVALGKRESSNNYLAVNQFGYLGKYQFGAPALIDLGYLIRSTTQQMLNKLAKLIAYETLSANPTPEEIERHNEVMALNAKYWTGKDGVYSTKKGFLDRGPVQEKCMDRWLVIVQKTLIRIKVIDNATTAQESGGFICAAHLIGPGGARDMKNGIIKKDGNGVTGNEYYKLGYAAVAGSAPGSPAGEPIIAPSEAKIENPAREPSTIAGVGQTVIKQATNLPGIGFSDPTGTFPRYEDEPDTSRLMRNQNIRETIVPGKDNTRRKSVRIAGGTETWDQPPVPYNTKYPYNQVLETESGHIMEFDDTPENERIHFYHRKGTFTEIDCNGTQVTRIVGDGYTILDRNGYISVSGNCNITVEGDANLCVKNDTNLEVNGNLNATISGSANWNVEGSWNVSAYGGANYKVHSGFGLITKGDANFRCAGSFGVKVDSNILLENLGKFDIDSKGIFTANSEGAMALKTYAEMRIGSKAQLNLKSDTNIVMNGSKVYLNSSVGNSATAGSKKDVYKLPNWQPPHLPASLNIPTLFPLSTPPRSFETVADFDDNPEATSAEKVEHEKILVQQGLNAVNPLPPKISEKPAEIPAGNPTPVTQPTVDFKEGQINLNDYISKNFTLGMLTKNAPIRPQMGLTDAQLAANLKYLAVNVLDLIKAKYPDMELTSGLRPMKDNPRSQHPLGMAADMRFRAHKSAEYIDIAKWIIGNTIFDQCLLEFRTKAAASKSGEPVTWIHVSYNVKGNRKMYFSMDNDERVSAIGTLKQITC